MNKKEAELPANRNPDLQKNVIYHESRFWQILNEIELPLIIILQKLFFIQKTYDFFNKKFSAIASSKLMSYMPLILLGLGKTLEARHFAKSAVLYALLSSLGKNTFIRRRPGSFAGVYSPDCATTSSFPSRHVMAASIIASFTPIKTILMIAVIFDRLVIANHYLTDCLFGMGFGFACVYMANLYDESSLIICLAAFSVFIWKGGAKIIGGCIPIAAFRLERNLSVLVFPLIFLSSIFRDIAHKMNHVKKEPFHDACYMLFAQSAVLYLMIISDSFLRKYITSDIHDLGSILAIARSCFASSAESNL
ncbi:PAP2 superfamily protein [Trichomonas vaginalis G3]|uniref:PAP2 superfamily protein n=1 Tax=Trichomonas vaginalis (strain ATCC PRA-98 / G3) TaxID=412133 RepID=A2EEM5_TRIV3|nr:acidPPc domain family [Trichomonas vaginalis G3]EAY08932.1 PAP2 superfamily protein [Trichomonas vaginalis G3]KAI5494398.1 acidPPc domain family [Trichomonas vaginalis G3]|eukprot:XP_001321155.1 PAP2 superfamily protein [Trichomonas vaginalis G3]